jgi:hypothetical protein
MAVPKPYDKKMKGESDKMYHRYEVHRDLGPNRSYKKTAKILNDEISQNSQKGSSDKKITEETLRKTAEKWFWNERCGLHDANEIYKEALEQDADFRETNQQIITILKNIIDFLEEKFESIFRNDDNYAATTQVRLLSDAVGILDRTIYNYRLSCGKSTDNKELKHQGELELSGNVGKENIFVYSAEEMERIQNIQEMDDETQKFLDELDK